MPKLLLAGLALASISFAHAEIGGPMFTNVRGFANCARYQVYRDDWSQVRAQSSIVARPLWRIPAGSIVFILRNRRDGPSRN